MTETAVIRGGRIVDARAHRAEPADIVIEGDTIAAVMPPGAATPPDARAIDARDRLVIPGLINAHTHSTSNMARSFGDRWTLELLLNGGIAPLGRQRVEDKYLSALIGAVEMVSKGCTACYDLFYEFPAPSVEGIEAVAQAYADVGIRAVIAPMLADVSFYHAVPGLLDAIPEELKKRMGGAMPSWEASLATVRRALEGWRFDRERVTLAVAPTIPMHCSDALLVGAATFAREHEIGFQTHLAESRVQGIYGLRKYGRSITAHLGALGILGPHLTAAHAIWIDDEDMARLADAGACIAHNPGSNLRLGSGLAATRRMLDHGLIVGIGTDSRGCSDNLNMFEATRLASFVSRVQGPDYRRWLTTDEAFAMATEGSARALGFPGRIGAIRPGCKADLVLLDARNLNYVPLNDVTNQIVNAEDATAVNKVLVGGRIVVDDGRVITVDTATLADRAQETVERLKAGNAGTLALTDRLEGIVGSFCGALARSPFHVHRYSHGEEA